MSEKTVLTFSYDDDHLPDWVFSKSPILRGLVANATNKNQQQVAETTKAFLMLIPMCVFGWWTSANIILPYYQQFTGMETGFLLFLVIQLLTLAFLPLAGLAGVIATIHAVWYAVRWKTNSATQNAGTYSISFDEDSVDGDSDEHDNGENQ